MDKYIQDQLKTGPRKQPNTENFLAIAWYTIRSNSSWLVTQYDSDQVLIWQIISTLRLIYETVADINYLVKLDNAEQKAGEILTAYQSLQSEKDVLKIFQSSDVRKKLNMGGTTEGRIIQEFGETDAGFYTMLCQFSHFNFYGASYAHEYEDPQTDPLRQLSIENIPDMLDRTIKAFSKVELFKDITDLRESS